MINIKDISHGIKDTVTKLACERFGVKEDEVKVTFKSDGDITITIIPTDFIETLGVEYSVTKED